MTDKRSPEYYKQWRQKQKTEKAELIKRVKELEDENRQLVDAILLRRKGN